MSDTVYQFQLGEFTGYILHEGYVRLEPSKVFFKGAADDDLASVLREQGLSADGITLPVSCLLLQRDKQTILIDCGAGIYNEGDDVGHLLDSLSKAGFQASDITHVIVTHVHFDHTSGLLDAEHQPTFPNARHMMQRGAWKLWTHDLFEGNPDAENDEYNVRTRKALQTLQPQLDLFEADAELLPGIHALDTAGHTANHISVHVISGEKHLIATSDAIVHPIHIQQLDWYPSWNVDGAKSKVATRRLLNLADETDALMFCCHFEFPGLGRVHQEGESWIWENADG